METIQQFSIKENGFKEIRKAAIKRTGFLFLCIIILSGGVNFYTAYQTGRDTSTAVIMIPLMLVVFVIVLYSGLKRQEELFQSYQLIIGPDFIRREQKNTPVIELRFSEVKEIYKSPNGALVIKGNKAIDAIGVPAQIKEYEKVEELLNAIKPIAALPTSKWAQTLYKFAPFAMIVAMPAFYAIENKLVVGVLGISIVTVLGYSFFVTMRSKNVSKRIKQMTWISLVVMASILFTLIHKLFYL